MDSFSVRTTSMNVNWMTANNDTRRAQTRQSSSIHGSVSGLNSLDGGSSQNARQLSSISVNFRPEISSQSLDQWPCVWSHCFFIFCTVAHNATTHSHHHSTLTIHSTSTSSVTVSAAGVQMLSVSDVDGSLHFCHPKQSHSWVSAFVPW